MLTWRDIAAVHDQVDRESLGETKQDHCQREADLLNERLVPGKTTKPVKLRPNCL
jgi:hypothetical protein